MPTDQISLKRDWVDLTAKLLLPVVLAIGGTLYTWHKDSQEEKQHQIDRQNELDRQQLDRDTGIIKLLASTNAQEKDLGLKIIGVLEKEKKFSPDLVPIVVAVAGGRPSDPSTQVAAGILSNAATQDPGLGVRIAAATQNAPVEVYVQIASESQRSDAITLQGELRSLGFAAPGVELVSNPTIHTFIRYFSKINVAKANQINDEMKKLGYGSSVQDFSNGRQLPQLEIWIGQSEPFFRPKH